MKTANDLRVARRMRVPVGKFTFICRRPVDNDFAEMAEARTTDHRHFAFRFVEDWEGVTEFDIFESGDDKTPVKFDRELWIEWCSDSKEFWSPISVALVDAYLKRKKAVDDAMGESDAGSKQLNSHLDQQENNPSASE